MRKLLIGLVAAILLIVASAIAVPFFIPTDTYKGKVIALVKQATGRDLRIDAVTIVDGQTSYLDLRTGEKRLLSDINMQLSLPNFAGPFDAKGQATWNAEPVTLTLAVGLPAALQSGGSSPLTIGLAAAPLKFDFQGDATGATLAGKGSIDLTNGKIAGVNLVAFKKNLASAVTGGEKGANETDFGALTGT